VAVDFILAGLGVFIGFIAGFFGVGGGTFLVPALMFLGFEIKAAIGISVMQMFFSSVLGSLINLKKNPFNIKSGIYAGVGGLVGSSFSGFILKKFEDWELELLFTILILFAIYRFFRANTKSGEGEQLENRYFFLIVGFLTGLVSITLGVGGALILGPILVGYAGYTIKQSVSLSLFYVVFSSMSGFVSLAYNGYVDYGSGLIVGLASLIGVSIGIYAVHKSNPKRHKKLIIGLYFTILFMMIWRVISG